MSEIAQGDKRSGVSVHYVKRRRWLSIGGWYDTMVGIEPMELSLGEFLQQLGITALDCAKATLEQAVADAQAAKEAQAEADRRNEGG